MALNAAQGVDLGGARRLLTNLRSRRAVITKD